MSKSSAVVSSFLDRETVSEIFSSVHEIKRNTKMNVIVSSSACDDDTVIDAKQFFRVANSSNSSSQELKSKSVYVLTDDVESVRSIAAYMPIIRAKIKHASQFTALNEFDVEDLTSCGVTAYYEHCNNLAHDDLIKAIRSYMDQAIYAHDQQKEIAERVIILETSGNKKHRAGKAGVDVALQNQVIDNADAIRSAVDALESENDEVALSVARALVTGMAHKEIPARLGITRLAFVQAIMRIEKALTAIE